MRRERPVGEGPAVLAERQAKMVPKTPVKVVSNGAGKSAAKNGKKAPANSNPKKLAKAPAGKARR